MRNNITSMVKTIKINENIHSRLLKIGSMGETFEDVIEKLLDFYEENSFGSKTSGHQRKQ